jgi:DNA-binding response OmpR family regulator
MQYSILVVEDDAGIRNYVKELLLENGYSTKTAADGLTALKMIESIQPDLVILDLKLPDIDGETVCTDIKKNYAETAVIILTAKDSTTDVVQGLDKGADDYIKKPFTADELLARVRARLRQKGSGKSKLKIANLELDTKTLQVKRGDKKIELTPQEYKLLEYLMTNRNQVLTREMILNRIWSSSPDIETRVVDVYIGYLRKKIDNGYKNKLIHSARGFGYMLKDES